MSVCVTCVTHKSTMFLYVPYYRMYQPIHIEINVRFYLFTFFSLHVRVVYHGLRAYVPLSSSKFEKRNIILYIASTHVRLPNWCRKTNK